MTGLQYNYMLGSAAKFNRQELFEQIIFESTVLGFPLDLQTYIKILGEDAGINICPELRAYLDTLMERDLSQSDQAFAKSVDQASRLYTQNEGNPTASSSGVDKSRKFKSKITTGKVKDD